MIFNLCQIPMPSRGSLLSSPILFLPKMASRYRSNCEYGRAVGEQSHLHWPALRVMDFSLPLFLLGTSLFSKYLSLSGLAACGFFSDNRLFPGYIFLDDKTSILVEWLIWCSSVFSTHSQP